jgi:hypothetical protein
LAASRFLALGLGLLLAGCSDPPQGPGDVGEALDESANQVDVAATDSTGIIRGIVVDDAVRPLASVLVVLEDGRNTTTSETGTFGFAALAPDTYFLTASRLGFATVKQSTLVAAGVAEPEVVRIQLKAIELPVPRVDVFSTRFISDIDVCTEVVGCASAGGAITNPAGVFGDAEGRIAIEVLPNATVAQAEVHWDPVTEASRVGHLSCYTFGDDGYIEQKESTGESPLVLRVNATAIIEGSRSVAEFFGCLWTPAPGAIIPAGAAYGQTLDGITHVFYHFTPDEDWVFGRDGEPPVPDGGGG